MSEDSAGYSAAAEVALVRERRTFVQNVARGLRQAPLTALLGLVIIALVPQVRRALPGCC